MTRKFKGIVETDSSLSWKIVYIPFSVKEVFGTRARMPVKGTVNGVPIRTSLFPTKSGEHFLMINKQVQKAAGGIEIGQKVEVIIEKDAEKRTVTPPAELKRLLSEDADLLLYFNTFSYSMRKYFADEVNNVKNRDAKVRRAEKIVMRLIELMDGEREPPPVLRAVFARNVKAAKGWEALTQTRKRSLLWRLFNSDNPEIREKNLTLVVAELVARAEKTTTKPKAAPNKKAATL